MRVDLLERHEDCEGYGGEEGGFDRAEVDAHCEVILVGTHMMSERR